MSTAEVSPATLLFVIHQLRQSSSSSIIRHLCQADYENVTPLRLTALQDIVRCALLVKVVTDITSVDYGENPRSILEYDGLDDQRIMQYREVIANPIHRLSPFYQDAIIEIIRCPLLLAILLGRTADVVKLSRLKIDIRMIIPVSDGWLIRAFSCLSHTHYYYSLQTLQTLKNSLLSYTAQRSQYHTPSPRSYFYYCALLLQRYCDQDDYVPPPSSSSDPPPTSGGHYRKHGPSFIDSIRHELSHYSHQSLGNSSSSVIKSSIVSAAALLEISEMVISPSSVVNVQDDAWMEIVHNILLLTVVEWEGGAGVSSSSVLATLPVELVEVVIAQLTKKWLIIHYA